MMLGRNLAQDPQFQQDLNKGIVDAACFVTEEYSEAIMRFVSDQVRAWESEKMVREVEKPHAPWRTASAVICRIRATSS